VYKCYKCGKILRYEEIVERSGGRLMPCSCGSRIFMKVRPQRVRRVRAI
jgi:DNA-directed RNA polymerase subunit RPC12/RpoP